MLCPTAPARIGHASTSTIPLWRWLLGGLVPLFAIPLTHSGLIAGSPSEVRLWRNWAFAVGVPVVFVLPSVVPALVLLTSHLTNQYFIQGVGRISVRRFLWLLLVAVPRLLMLLLLITATAPVVTFAVMVVLLPVFILGGMLAPSLVIGGTFLISGYLVGHLLPGVERRAMADPSTDTDAMKAAHRRGGALAAGLLIAGLVGVASLPAGWFDVPWARGRFDDPIIIAAIVMAAAWLPHLLLTWRAVAAAGPELTALPLADFVPRLVTVVFVIVALAAIEDVLLGGHA